MTLPKFIYLSCNCSVWIPNSFFREVDSCISTFMWNGAIPHLAKSTLHLPVKLGGLALPNFQIYFWAAVLVTTYWWFEGSHDNSAVYVEAACLGSLSDLQNLPNRGVGSCADVLSPTRPTLWGWTAARRRFYQEARWTPVQPLWGNPNFVHPDPHV